MELTQKYFDKAINNLSTRADIEEVKSEMVMVRARLDRHDQWLKKLAEKVNIKLEA